MGYFKFPTEGTQDHCPVCGQLVDQSFVMAYDEAWISANPFEGLSVYGPYDVAKEVICDSGRWLHFRFVNETRLVELTKRDPYYNRSRPAGDGDPAGGPRDRDADDGERYEP